MNQYHHVTPRSVPWIFAAGLCLGVSGCAFRQGYIDNQEDALLSNDHAAVSRGQRTYDTSVIENGLYSGQTKAAATELDDTRHKLVIDQRQFDDYKSASGQSAESRQ